MSEQKQPLVVSMPEDVANAVLGYLGTRPYQEVAKLIATKEI